MALSCSECLLTILAKYQYKPRIIKHMHGSKLKSIAFYSTHRPTGSVKFKLMYTSTVRYTDAA